MMDCFVFLGMLTTVAATSLGVTMLDSTPLADIINQLGNDTTAMTGVPLAFIITGVMAAAILCALAIVKTAERCRA